MAGRIDPVAAKTWRVGDADNDPLVSAYLRARSRLSLTLLPCPAPLTWRLRSYEERHL